MVPGPREEMTVTTSTYQVSGMTCGHCVSAVKGELGKLDGVSDVDVDLATGTVTVRSETELDAATVEAAVDEAGYELVS